MTYNEILSAAQSLSETERQSLLQALSVGNQCEATVPESSRLSALLEKQGCCPHCGSNRYYRFGLIVEATATTVSVRTTVHNASSARIAAGLSPNIPAHGSRSSTRKGL